ncbi:MAG TPA: GAF domain-containing SpoIIE family protein phosphatase [Acidobacteriaceae bacterium]|nr:GAF domain-containing SpoIIE family protein phosphatase [Acidobacteriaceae bacterium]
MSTNPIIAKANRFEGLELPVEQMEDLLRLQKAAQQILPILDLDQLIDKIVTDVARSFGCLEASLYLHDDATQELILASVCGCTHHTKGSRKKIGKGTVGHAAATGELHYAPDVRVDPWYIACEPSTLSEVSIPLHVQGKLVGVFSTSHHRLDAFPPAQLRLLRGLSHHIAVAIHNARRFGQEQQERQRMSREAAEARTIQQALLPRMSPFIPGFSVSGLSIPMGEVGGDWYDYIPLEDGSWALVLADVSGKGMPAALLMSATRGMLRSLADMCKSPAGILNRLNRLMVEDFPSGKFVTLIYAVLDPAKRTLKFASAGHLPPLLIDGEGARFLQTEAGMPLGLTFGEYSDREVALGEGARLLLYSDGITEAERPDGEDYGLERLRQAMLSADASTETIVGEVRRHVNGAGLQDDATVILVKA